MTQLEIQSFKEEHELEFLNKVCELAGYKDVEYAISQGVSIHELEAYQPEANRIICGEHASNKLKFKFRSLMESYLTNKFGDKTIYFNSNSFIAHKVNKQETTMLKRYGYKNPGENPEHIKAMSKTKGQTAKCKNPFASENFRYLEYIKGKAVLPKDQEAFRLYSKQVWRLTDRIKINLEYTGYCYYTGIKLLNDNKKLYNEYNYATIDHKVSIMYGFIHKIPAEEIAALDNLCWCSKHFNSLKMNMTEDEVKSSGVVDRYKEVMELIEWK